jgi:hypothetical protein
VSGRFEIGVVNRRARANVTPFVDGNRDCPRVLKFYSQR